MKYVKIKLLGIIIVLSINVSISKTSLAKKEITPAKGVNKLKQEHDSLDNHLEPVTSLELPEVLVEEKALASTNKKFNKAASCNDEAFITSGNDLLNQVSSQGFDCVERLFDLASAEVRAGVFTQANIATIANEAKIKSQQYNGNDPNKYIRSLFYWIKAFYYYRDRELLTEENQNLTENAIDALVANDHFYDNNEENADVVRQAINTINNAVIKPRFINLAIDLLDHFDQSYNDTRFWGYNFAVVFFDAFEACSGIPECRSDVHDQALVAKVGDYIHDNLSWLDTDEADFHLNNLGNQLANFYSSRNDSHFDELKQELETQLNRVFDNYGPIKGDVARKAYLQAMFIVNYYQQCEVYDLCSKKEEIITQVLDNRINCSGGTLFIWGQDMNQDQLEWTCSSLGEHESYFHETLQTNQTPVIPDDNDSLRMVIFNDRGEWRIYGTVLFGAGTNNGGQYLEGDPSTPGDQATFFAYEHVSERPIFDIWNLRHEYIHYLDGRFIKQGDFRFNNDAGRTVWYGEGIAEYISLRDCNDGAISQAASGTYALSTIFQNEYGVGQTRIYPWGYLANRFMFENHNTEFFAMLELFKQGKNTDYRNNMVDVWVDDQTFDDEFSQWLSTVDSTGCVVDNTRPPSPIEDEDVVDVDDIQGGDQIGIDACALGLDSRDDGEISAGNAGCLIDVNNNRQVQMFLRVPNGLVDVSLQITVRHGSGNATLLHKYEDRPTATDYDYISADAGNNETILIDSVVSGLHYIHVMADSEFSGATLLVRYIQNGEPPVSEFQAISPNGITTASHPVFTWTEVAGAPRYAVVAKDSSGTMLINNSTGSIDCPAGICSYSRPSVNFPNGDYSWNVRVINADNSNGIESNTLSFTVDSGGTTPPPATIVDTCGLGQTPIENGEITEANAVCLQTTTNSNQKQMAFYVYNDKAGKTLEIRTSYGTGNGNLLHKYGGRPTADSYDYISANSGNEERILVENIQFGWNYIHVRADTQFSGVTLLARYLEE